MKIAKKFLAILLCSVLLLAIIPISTFTVYAKEVIQLELNQERILTLAKRTDSSYIDDFILSFNSEKDAYYKITITETEGTDMFFDGGLREFVLFIPSGETFNLTVTKCGFYRDDKTEDDVMVLVKEAQVNEVFGYRILEDDTAEIVNCTLVLPETVVIPSTVDGYTVTSISGWGNIVGNYGSMFTAYSPKVKKLVLPKTLKKIGDCAFAGCKNLAELYIPDSVTTIGVSVFAGCDNLNSVTIPASVTSVAPNAFTCAANLHISVDENNPIYDSRENCNAIIETTSNTLIAACVNTTVPDTVTSIGRLAFCFENDIKEIVFPASVKHIATQSMWFVDKITILNPDCIIENPLGALTFGKKLIICSYEKSSVENWANESKYEFIALDETPVIPDNNPKLGDVDSDNVVSIMDATQIQLHLAKSVELNSDQFAVADTDKDGEITIMDVTRIQLFLAKVITEF